MSAPLFFGPGQVLFVCRLALRRRGSGNVRRLGRSVFNLLFRPHAPSTLIIGITYRCQYSCHYCSTGSYPADGPLLSAGEIKRVIDEAAAIGVSKINFFGGEPLLRDDLDELIRHAASRNLFVFIDTNGELLDRDRVELLRSAGASVFCVNAQTRDSCGESDAFDLEASCAKIDRISGDCLSAGMPCVVSVYVDDRVLADGGLERLISCARGAGAAGVRLLLPISCGRLDGRRPELTGRDRDRLRGLIDNRFVYCESVLYGQSPSGEKCEAAAGRTAYISPYGDIQLCYAVPFSFGNIRADGLKRSLERMRPHDLLKAVPSSGCPMNDPAFRKVLSGLKS